MVKKKESTTNCFLLWGVRLFILLMLLGCQSKSIKEHKIEIDNLEEEREKINTVLNEYKKDNDELITILTNTIKKKQRHIDKLKYTLIDKIHKRKPIPVNSKYRIIIKVNNKIIVNTTSTSVLVHFFKKDEYYPIRLSSSGTGKHDLVSKNESNKGILLNRKTDIVIVPMEENHVNTKK